ncbi:uncharacterized protein LOC117178025 [Belonocnema kinseyi]|uniref:uncharacterized protein LOC117178025 n=1 Tax=Belonocnema kinseyi TaxID=2817044 RepID=UPI00143D0D80|nr:uncharacterized protein LOC117178025 [Belonocnema kinseyi]
MEALWNKLDLKRPSSNTWKVSSQEIDFKMFLKKLEKTINDLESQEMLHFEAALLGRLIYRMKCKFRSDKGLKNMEKTNRALLNYLKLSLENDYKYLMECTEMVAFSDNVILPTKQMVEYTLVRTQSFAKLMCRIENVSQEAAHFLKSRVNIGQAWDVSLIALSVVSRIWVLSRHLIKKSCDWYSSLYESAKSFKAVGAKWLPKNYILPSSLRDWLKLPWIDEELPSISTHEEIKKNIFNLIKPANDDSEEELNFEIEDVSEIPKPSTSVEKMKNIEKIAISNIKNTKLSQEQISFPVGAVEIGQRISRDAFNSFVKQQRKSEAKKSKKEQGLGKNQNEINQSEIDSLRKSNKNRDTKKKSKDEAISDPKELDKRKKVLRPNDLKTENDLILFLKPKSYPGMDKLQWQMLKKNVRQFLVDINNGNESVSKKKKLKMVFKKIREWTN